MKRGIERTLGNLDDVARYLLKSLRDAVAVNGAKRDDLQDQQIERSLRQIRPGVMRPNTSDFYMLASDV